MLLTSVLIGMCYVFSLLDLRVSLSASPSPPTQVTGPVLTPEGGNRVMNEDDPATIGIQNSTPVD